MALTERIGDLAPEEKDVDGGRAYRGLYKAQVTDNADPDKRGRLKLLIPQVMGDQQHPEWAEPVGMGMTPGKGYGGLDVPQKDDWVWVEFEGGHVKHPRWHSGWWAKDEIPDELKKNYPDVRGFKTKAGHVVYFDDKDGKVHFQHKDGHLVELSNDGAQVITKDKAVVIDAGQGQVSITSKTKVVVDAPAVELVKGADHALPLFDTFLQDFSEVWTDLIAMFQGGTVGGPVKQQLFALPAILGDLQNFGAKIAAGVPYFSKKVKNG